MPQESKIELQNSTSKSTEIGVIHWHETQKWRGNPYAVAPSTAMLLPGGDNVLRTLSKGGGGLGGKATERTNLWVTYDRGYVVGWVAQVLLRHLGSLPYNELQKLISEAMQEAKTIKDRRKAPEVVRGRHVS